MPTTPLPIIYAFVVGGHHPIEPHYTVFGGNCKSKHSDPAVVLVDESQFIMVVIKLSKMIINTYILLLFILSAFIFRAV